MLGFFQKSWFFISATVTFESVFFEDILNRNATFNIPFYIKDFLIKYKKIRRHTVW